MIKETWISAKNILCLRLDSVGDVLMTSPAFRALKQSLPGSRLTLLTSPASVEAGRLIPEIDDVLAYAAPWMKPAPNDKNLRGNIQTMGSRLRENRYDAAVIFTVYSQSPHPAAMLCLLAEIPLRLAHSHENPYHLLTDWIHDPEPMAIVRHEVRRQLDLVASIGAQTNNEHLSLKVGEAAKAAVQRRLENEGIQETDPLVVFHPGATAPSRRYPPERFAAAAQELAAQWGCRIVFTGSPHELGLIETIRREIGSASHSLAGLLNLEELAALIGQADLLVTNNTGPAHIAAAVGTSIVDLYALTNPQHAPWMVRHHLLFQDVPCRFCYKSECPEGHHDCLRGVSPQTVVSAAVDLLFDAPSPTPVPRSPLQLCTH